MSLFKINIRLSGKLYLRMARQFFFALSCFVIPFILAMPCSCSRIDPFEDFENIPNPYEYRTSSEFIAVFGDIQYYTNTSCISLFKHSLGWISYVSKDVDIICTLHTGDITNNNAVSEWKCFEKAVKRFSESMPFISNIGDHDYTWDGALICDRNSTRINEYIQFPLVTDRIEAEFEARHLENIVIRNEIHGSRYDLLLLEFGPRKEVVKWAKEWVSSHPDIKYILMNHEYLEQGGGLRTLGLKCMMRLKDSDYATPEELWNQLVRCNDNIAWVLCGHVGGLYAVTFEKNDFGREVCQIQHNIQGEPYRYDNWLMMWEFPEDSNEALVSIVNTRTGELYDSDNSLFTFKYRY